MLPPCVAHENDCSMTNTPFLFVYGSLRPGSGHAMADWLRAQAEWRGRAGLEAARLYRVDWYPALVPGVAGERVQGDLYRLAAPERAWPVLDEFEGVRGGEDDEYARAIATVTGPDGVRVEAWVYWYRHPVQGLAPVAGGDWLARD